MLELTLLISVVATAMIYVLSAYGLVVAFRVAGVFNFAFGLQAALAAFLYWQFVVGWGWNRYIGAALVVLVIAPITGILIQQILFRRPRDVLATIVITTGLAVALTGLIELLWAPDTVRSAVGLFGSGYWRVGGASVTANDVGVIASGLVIGFLLWLLLNRSRTGLKMRAVVDSSELAGASGIPTSRMNAVAWIVASVLASVSGILIAPILDLNIALISALVVSAFAVAVFAGLRSLVLVIPGALILAYAQAITERYPKTFTFIGGSPRSLVPFVMLGLVLLLHPAARQTVRVVGGGLERQLRERATGKVGWALVLIAIGLFLTSSLQSSWMFTAAQVGCFSIAALSLVLLVGASGQVSLCQVTFMGVAAVMMGRLAEAGVPWGVALVAGVVTSVLSGILLALTAFRLRGLYLALITYAAAYAALVGIFQNTSVIGPSGLQIGRPSIFGLDLTSDQNYLYFVAAILVIVLLLVGGLLRGPWGRALQTLSAGDTIASVSGLPARSWKVAVFAVSAGLAGLAGCLFVSTNFTASAEVFAPEQSVTLLVVTVVGGITSPAGAVLAGFLSQGSYRIVNILLNNPGAWSLLLFGVTAMQIAIMHPAGLASLLPQAPPGAGGARARLGRVFRSRRSSSPSPTP